MRGTARLGGVFGALAVAVATAGVALAQATTTPAEQPKKRWSNDTELSLVATQGNSDTLAFGLKELYKISFDSSRFQFKSTRSASPSTRTSRSR